MSELPIIGIDLGTTHTTLARAPVDPDSEIENIRLHQLVGPNAIDQCDLLSSTIYFAHPGETGVSVPWAPRQRHVVGEHAHRRGLEVPGRLVASAKSWLSCTRFDRRADLLPPEAAEDVEKISPVEATFRILDHLTEAWAYGNPDQPPLSEHEIVLTVPASFDAAARELTVEAALAADLTNLTLLEEPQAALYAWLERHKNDFRKLLTPGDVILVVDVGGGTTDFSAILVEDDDGSLELRRIAVGDHILLGGDNMDLALAHKLRAKLEESGPPIDRWQMQSLAFAARKAKEELFNRPDLASAPVVVAGRGADLLGSTRRTDLVRAEVESLLVDGFFPEIAHTHSPISRSRSALTQVGLPYASDPAVTRHLASFLRRQAAAVPQSKGTLLHPTWVLFNGGVFKSELFRTRLENTLNAWMEAESKPRVRILPGEDLDLAVARGAAYYGRVKKGRGLRIRGGTAQAYYVGIENPTPAVPGIEPPVSGLCVAPFGMEEGSELDLQGHTLGVVVGEPVSFRFFGSSVRRKDTAGTMLESTTSDDISELAPIEVTLPADGREPGEVILVRLRAAVTSIGTLELVARPLEPLNPDEQWKIELNVRSSNDG